MLQPPKERVTNTYRLTDAVRSAQISITRDPAVIERDGAPLSIDARSVHGRFTVDRRGKRSRWSVWSEDSFLSIGSKGSFCSIGSVGSAFSVGSVGSWCSAFSIGSAWSFASALSAMSAFSVLSWRSNGGVLAAPAQGGRTGSPPDLHETSTTSG